MTENNALNEQEIIALLESQKEVRIEYPRALYTKRRNVFLKSIALLGVTIISWSFLGRKGVFKISGLTQWGIKILLTVAAAETIAVAYVYRAEILDFILPATSTPTSVEISPFGSATIAPTNRPTPYPTPSLAPSITPESSSTPVAQLTHLPILLPAQTITSIGNNPGLIPSATDDKPGNSFGLTKTPKPGEGPNNAPNGSLNSP